MVETEYSTAAVVPSAADYLQLNVRSLYTALNAGTIPARRIGKQWRISRNVLVAWLSGDEVMESQLIGRLFATELDTAQQAHQSGQGVKIDDVL